MSNILKIDLKLEINYKVLYTQLKIIFNKIYQLNLVLKINLQN